MRLAGKLVPLDAREMTAVTDEITISVPITVSEQMLSNLLISALEGGSNYWIRELSLFDRYAKRTRRLTDNPVRNLQSIMVLADDDGTWYRVDMPPHPCLEKGLKIMAANHTNHFTNLINDDDDAETGDVFIQCCIFGEVLYG